MNDAIPVLVVDDDKSIQGIVEETLLEDGFLPTIVSSGEEAINLLAANKYYVMILDISLGPDRIKGWPIARRARAVSPDMPVIYITGGPRHDWAVEGVPNSVLLAKPFAPAQLVTAVLQLLNRTNFGGLAV